MKKLIFLLIVISIPPITAGMIVSDLVRYAESPVGIPDHPVTIDIPRGQSFNRVAELLHEKGLIAHPVKFKIIARYTGHDKTIKFGEYRLHPTMNPLEILSRFTAGDVLLHRVTIPEGFTFQEVAARLEKAELCEGDAFLAQATDPDFVRSLNIPGDTIEGYLFPDTYHFEKTPSPETIIMTMVSRFRRAFSPEWELRAIELGLNVHEIVTLASIIEKETGRAEERTIVSSVFHNRLEQGIPLGSDPTVIYGIEKFDGNITRKHLRAKTPYNTYVIAGLPPGPIASPGRAALEAALYPAKTDYLFFVAKPDRTHHFSLNYSEHSRAVQEYQIDAKKKATPAEMGPPRPPAADPAPQPSAAAPEPTPVDIADTPETP